MSDATGQPPRPPRLKFNTKGAHKRKHGPSNLSATPIKNEINVTPLVDVVLVLLIIFMVVTPMLSRGVEVELPTTIHHEKKADTGQQVVVAVARDGKIYVGTDEVQPDALPDKIRQEMKTHSGEVFVKGDKHLDYGTVRRVLERVHETGASNVELGTDEPKEPKAQ